MPTLLPHYRLRLRLVALLRLFIGILLPLLLVGLIAEDLLEGQSFAFETPFLWSLHGHATPMLDRVAVFFSDVGGVAVIAPVSAVLLAALWFKQRRQAMFWGLSVAGAAGLNVVMKLLMHRSRPELWPRLVQEQDASFPSGHSMYSAAFITALILLTWQTPYRWLVVVMGIAFSGAVGLSRLYLGVHYPTDVLCGWLTGVAWVLGVYSVARPVYQQTAER